MGLTRTRSATADGKRTSQHRELSHKNVVWSPESQGFSAFSTNRLRIMRVRSAIFGQETRLRRIRARPASSSRQPSCAGVTCVVAFGPFRQKPLSAALATPGQGGTPAFGPHTRPKPVLAFPGSFRWLVSAFHNIQRDRWAFGSGYGRRLRRLVNSRRKSIFAGITIASLCSL
jgi:hypothetical protein